MSEINSGVPILPTGMTNEVFYKEQAEYWKQIARECRAKIDCLSRGAVPVRDDGWRFDVENMPKVFGAKNIEIAYVSLENKPATAIVGWDGSRFVTARYIEKNIKMCPPETIYAWKMSTPPPAIPERSDLQPKDTAK